MVFTYIFSEISLKLHNKSLFVFATISLSLISLFSFAKTTATPLPISAYGSLPSVSNVKLSPNGENVAMVQNRNGTLMLMTYNLANGKSQALLQTDNVDVILNWFTWGNDDVLLISAAYTTKQYSIKYTSTRLYKFDLSTDNKLKLLIKPKVLKNERNAQFQDNIISLIPAQPDSILMAIDFDIANKPSLYKINIRSGKRSRIKKGKTYIEDWIADQQGLARISYNVANTDVSYKLFDAKGKFEKDLWSYEVFEKEVVHILGFDLDPNLLYIRALHQGRYAIFKVNLQDEKLKRELIYSDDKYDVNGSLIYSPKTGAVVGLSHRGDNDNKVYWDEEYTQTNSNGII